MHIIINNYWKQHRDSIPETAYLNDLAIKFSFLTVTLYYYSLVERWPHAVAAVTWSGFPIVTDPEVSSRRFPPEKVPSGGSRRFCVSFCVFFGLVLIHWSGTDPDRHRNSCPVRNERALDDTGFTRAWLWLAVCEFVCINKCLFILVSDNINMFCDMFMFIKRLWMCSCLQYGVFNLLTSD